MPTESRKLWQLCPTCQKQLYDTRVKWTCCMNTWLFDRSQRSCAIASWSSMSSRWSTHVPSFRRMIFWLIFHTALEQKSLLSCTAPLCSNWVRWICLGWVPQLWQFGRWSNHCFAALKDFSLDSRLMQGLSDVFLRSILVRMKYDSYPPGEAVVMEGEIGSNMFFVSKGQLHVCVQQVEVARLGEGELFGEVAMYHNKGRRTATVSTITHCEVNIFLHSQHMYFIQRNAGAEYKSQLDRFICVVHWEHLEQQLANGLVCLVCLKGMLTESKRYGSCTPAFSKHYG